MGAGLGGSEKQKRSLPVIPFYLAAMLITGSHGLRHAPPPGDVMQIFSGGQISIDSISSPVSSASIEAEAALEDDNFVDPKDRSPRELPVWPPPAQTAPVDPAANAMIGAPPQRVDWPNGLPSVQRKNASPKNPSAQQHH
jgi:hypothetical protein